LKTCNQAKARTTLTDFHALMRIELAHHHGTVIHQTGLKFIAR